MYWLWAAGAGLWVVLGGTNAYRLLVEPPQDSLTWFLIVCALILDVALALVYGTRAVVGIVKDEFGK